MLVADPTHFTPACGWEGPLSGKTGSSYFPAHTPTFLQKKKVNYKQQLKTYISGRSNKVLMVVSTKFIWCSHIACLLQRMHVHKPSAPFIH